MPRKKFSELHGATDITFFWDLPEFKYVSFSFTSLRKYWPRWLRCFKTFMKWHFFQQFPAFSSWQECITPYLVSLFLTLLSLNDLTDFLLFSCFLTIAYFSVLQNLTYKNSFVFFYVGWFFLTWLWHFRILTSPLLK